MRGRLELLWLVGVSVQGPRTYGRRLATLFALVAAGIVSFGFGLSAPTDAESEPSLGFRPPTLAMPRSTAPPVTKPTPAEPAGAGASAIASPRFVWAPEPGAVGYRLALYRGDRVVFDRDVTEPALQLPASWTFKGKVERLTHGTYRWVVRPYFGKTKLLGPAIVSSQYLV